MRCEEIRKKLSSYVDQEVLPEEKREVSQHLKWCFSCQWEMRKLLVMKKLLRAMDGYWEEKFSRRVEFSIQKFWQREKKQKVSWVILFCIFAVLSLFFVFCWRGWRIETKLHRELVSVSTLTSLEVHPDTRSQDVRAYQIRVVEFTLDR
ncbi:MAG: anti-sigma factor family protein [Candidatus Caldatribacteriaceae bacterium]